MELVESLEALPVGGASAHWQRRQIFRKLQGGELGGSDPNLSTRLIPALLKRCQEIEPWERGTLHSVVKRSINEGAEEGLIRELIEKYLEYGGLEHQELLELLRARNQDSGVDQQ